MKEEKTMALQAEGITRIDTVIFNQRTIQSQLDRVIAQNEEQLALQGKLLASQDTANLLAWLQLRQTAGENGVAGLHGDPALVREVRERLGV